MVLPVGFRGAGVRLSPAGVAAAAEALGLDQAHLLAVIRVETSGSGFDVHGRPKMLFEPHVFYRQLEGKALADAVLRGLAYESWGERPYPPDSYPRMGLAYQLNPEAALKSASWGLGQIMGYNFSLLGYNTVAAMVTDACVSEDRQLAQMAGFIKVKELARFLIAGDWVNFARRYNGSGNAAAYASKLNAAYTVFTTVNLPETKDV